MSTQTYGSVAAMEFRRPLSIDFANIVEEFDIAFQMVDSRTRALSWDSDNIALIDRDCVRVALGWLPASEKGQTSHLVVAVGAAPHMKPGAIEPASFRFLAERIVERTRDYLPFTAVLHGEASQPVGAGLVETVFGLLRADAGDMAGDMAGARPKTRKSPQREDAEIDAYADMVDEMSPPWTRRWNRVRDRGGFTPARGALQGLSSQLGQMLQARAQSTQPLRLTIHTLALSLCLYVPPVGAALFAYTMLRDVTTMAV